MGNKVSSALYSKLSKKNKKEKKESIIIKKEYKFNPNVVKIKYYVNGKETYPPKNLTYSYIYKGVPGGWHI